MKFLSTVRSERHSQKYDLHLSAPLHHLQVMEFYCESCETAMCLECTEGEHREHVTVPLRDVLEQHKSALKNQLDAVRNRYNFHCFHPYQLIKCFWKVLEVLEV